MRGGRLLRAARAVLEGGLAVPAPASRRGKRGHASTGASASPSWRRAPPLAGLIRAALMELGRPRLRGVGAVLR